MTRPAEALAFQSESASGVGKIHKVLRLFPQFWCAIVLCLLTVDSGFSQTFSQKQILQDLRQLETALRRHHPNLYAHRSAREIKTLFTDVKSNVQAKVDFWDATAHIQRMLAAVCDSHTTIDLMQYFRLPQVLDQTHLSIPLAINSDGAFVDDDTLGDKTRKLIAINQRPAGEIADMIQKMTSIDGCPANQTIYTRLQSPIASTVLGHTFEKRSRFHVDTRDTGSGSSQLAVREPVSFAFHVSAISHPNSYFSDDLLSEFGFVPLQMPGSEESRRRVGSIVLWQHKERRIYYIRVNSFLGGKRQTKETDVLLRSMIAEIPEHVILDLSFNGGGQVSTASHLMSYFLRRSHRIARRLRMTDTRPVRDPGFTWVSEERRKAFDKLRRLMKRSRKRRGQHRINVLKQSFGNPSYNGKLTILVSPMTRSAATATALTLKRVRGATIVGTSAGSPTPTSCFAPPGSLRLKNTGLPVLIPRICFDRQTAGSAKGDFLKADIEVPPLSVSSMRLPAENILEGMRHVMDQIFTGSTKDL